MPKFVNNGTKKISEDPNVKIMVTDPVTVNQDGSAEIKEKPIVLGIEEAETKKSEPPKIEPPEPPKPEPEPPEPEKIPEPPKQERKQPDQETEEIIENIVSRSNNRYSGATYSIKNARPSSRIPVNNTRTTLFGWKLFK